MSLRPGSPRPRSTPLKRTGPLKRSRIKRRRRSPDDFARIYGPKERVAWIKAQACVWCVHRGIVLLPVESQNAHVKTGGMGYKADYQMIVPLCAPHHEAYDNHRAPFDKRAPRLAMEIHAKVIEQRWQNYRGAVPSEPRSETP